MPLKKAVQILVFLIVFGALSHALFVVIHGVAGSDGQLNFRWFAVETTDYGFKCVVLLVAFLLTYVSWCVIDQRVGTELLDGDEREYVEAAWLSGLFGLLLMITEAAFEFGFLGLKDFKVEFILEDLLLGVSALCMLSEEVRLLRATMRAAKKLDVGPGFDRLITPPPQGS